MICVTISLFFKEVFLGPVNQSSILITRFSLKFLTCIFVLYNNRAGAESKDGTAEQMFPAKVARFLIPTEATVEAASKITRKFVLIFSDYSLWENVILAPIFSSVPLNSILFN